MTRQFDGKVGLEDNIFLKRGVLAKSNAELVDVESAVTNMIHGRPVSNRDVLTNPESLDYYESIVSDLQRE